MAANHDDDMMKKTKDEEAGPKKSATIRASDDRTNDLDSQFEVGTFISKSYRVIARK